MTDSEAAHAGIELDLIDLSALTRTDSFSNSLGLNLDTVDRKTLIKTLLKKILDNESFLSFSSQVQDVNKILKMKYSSASDIADVILKDVALTTKLLKLVNSAFYGQFAPRGIATVSEAMIILGTEEIKLAAASLKIYELMQNSSSVQILKDKALKSLQCSMIARQIAMDEGIKDLEAIQISALLYTFGEYLIALFSPEIFIRVEIAAEERAMSSEQASKAIIGISYSDLGRYVAARWHLPASILNAMKPVTRFDLPKARLGSTDLYQYICAFANELCQIDFHREKDCIGQKTVEIAARYRQCLDIPASQAVDLLKKSWQKIIRHSEILKISR